MGFLKGLAKTAIVVKVVQVAQRELRKPENQRKIKETVQRVKQKVR